MDIVVVLVLMVLLMMVQVYMGEVDLVVIKVVLVLFVLFGGVLIVLLEHFQVQMLPQQQYGLKIIRI